MTYSPALGPTREPLMPPPDLLHGFLDRLFFPRSFADGETVHRLQHGALRVLVVDGGVTDGTVLWETGDLVHVPDDPTAHFNGDLRAVGLTRVRLLTPVAYERLEEAAGAGAERVLLEMVERVQRG